MPTSESESSSSSWKAPSPSLSLALSGKMLLNGRPPSCPTPDYDTSSSSSVSSPASSLIILSKNSAPQGNISSPSYTRVNSNRLTATDATKSTAPASQTAPKNADMVEMQSIESFTLTNPQSLKPKPPETYFVPVKSMKNAQNLR